MRISDWSSDVCSSDLTGLPLLGGSQELESLIPAFRAEDQAVQMTARVPRALVGGLQAVLGSGEGGGVDLELVRAIYGELMAGAVLEPEIGRASGRERVGPAGWNAAGAGSLKKKLKKR